jgi:hypothetical protein
MRQDRTAGRARGEVGRRAVEPEDVGLEAVAVGGIEPGTGADAHARARIVGHRLVAEQDRGAGLPQHAGLEDRRSIGAGGEERWRAVAFRPPDQRLGGEPGFGDRRRRFQHRTRRHVGCIRAAKRCQQEDCDRPETRRTHRCLAC